MDDNTITLAGAFLILIALVLLFFFLPEDNREYSFMAMDANGEYIRCETIMENEEVMFANHEDYNWFLVEIVDEQIIRIDLVDFKTFLSYWEDTNE